MKKSNSVLHETSNVSLYPWFLLLIAMVLLAGCSSICSNKVTKSESPVRAGIANPASALCINKGGSLSLLKREDGGEYSICLFEDNRQCEKWAMMRGDCPVGGLKVTGYVTPAARYCAITGGTYTITGQSNSDKEQGICDFKNGLRCEVWDYFYGRCFRTEINQSR